MRNSVLTVTAIFIVSMLMGIAAPPETGREQLEGLAEVIGPVADRGPFALLALIIVNNVLTTLFMVPLGLLLAIPPIFFAVVNGYLIGAVASAVANEAGTGLVVASLVPHGIIELPAALLAAGLGFWVGLGVLRRLTGRQGAAKARLRTSFRIYLVWVLPALLVAGFIEVFITPSIMDAVANGVGADETMDALA